MTATSTGARVEEMTIRPADLRDAPEIASLLDQLGYDASPAAVERRLRRLAASDADELLVAVWDGRVVGLAGVHVSAAIEYDGDAAKLSALVVDEGHRRRGIGERLVAAVEDEARRRGCVLLFLTTAERRAGAHAFYRAVGLEETGRRFAKRLEP
jgi:GNAT superfamily N-acetyltransferase